MTTSCLLKQAPPGLRKSIGALALFTLLLITAPFQRALAQGTAPTLGTAQSFAVLGASTVTNTGPSVITGDLGVSPGTAVVGFPPGLVAGGSIHAADAVAANAQADATTAFGTLAGEACNTTYGVPTDLSGQTLVPGVYCFASSAGLTGTVTLNAGGDPNAVFIFDIGSTLITGSNATVALINGAQACNVFWKVGSSATLGVGTDFLGTIIALTSVTLDTNAILSGRALALNGAVTLDSNIVTVTACGVPVNSPPVLGKSFSQPTIVAGGNSTLTLTLSNSNATAATISSALTDNLPSGTTIAGSASTTCGGTVSATLGGSSVSLSGGSIPANGTCTVTVDVTAAVAGSYINSLASGALQTSQGSSVAPAVATLTVTPVSTPDLVPPTLGKSFDPATIAPGGVSSLILTLSNANAVVDTLTAPLVDHLPSGLTVSGSGASTTCGGTVTAASGSSTVTLAGGTIPANGSCTVTVSVTAPLAGSFINSISAGALQTDNGNNSAAAVATLTVPVVVPTPVAPTLAKSFTPTHFAPGGVSSLVITLSNSNAVVDVMTAPLVDHLPTGLTVSGSSAATTCGGSVAATSGSSTVTLTGGTIPANGSCTVTVSVTAALAGTYANSIAIGALQTDNGNNGAAANATVTVAAITPALVAPTLAKSFNPSTISIGTLSTLVFTLSNSNAVVDTLTAALTDHLPVGLTVYGTPTTTCGGTVTAPKGSTSITLNSGTIPAHSSCTVSVTVSPDCACTYNNVISVGALHTNNGSNAAAAVATLTVGKAAPSGGTPKVSKYFYPSEIKPNGSTTLTITLSNPNATVAKLTAPFTDHLPAGVFVYGVPSTNNTCGGTLSAAKGSSYITLTGGQIPVNSGCRLVVYVSGPNAGTFVNTLMVGVLKTSNGNNANSSSATLIISTSSGAGPSLLKAFSPSTISNDGISTLTITLKNPYATAAKLTAPLIDYMPAHLVVYGSASNTCGGVVTATAGSSKVTLTGGAIPANGSCTVTVKVTAPCNTYFNNLAAGALQTSNGSNQQPYGAKLTVTAF